MTDKGPDQDAEETVGPQCLRSHWAKRQTRRDDDGCIDWLTPATAVFYNRVSGQLGETLYPCIIDNVDTLIAAGHKVIIFNDWEDMTGYVPAARNNLTKWVVKNRQAIELHFVTRSKLVTMGVMFAGTAIRSMHMHTKRADFDAVLQSSLELAQPTP